MKFSCRQKMEFLVRVDFAEMKTERWKRVALILKFEC